MIGREAGHCRSLSVPSSSDGSTEAVADVDGDPSESRLRDMVGELGNEVNGVK